MIEPQRSPIVEQAPEGLRGGLVTATIMASIVIILICVAVVGLLLFRKTGRVAGGSEVPAYPVASAVGGIHQLPLDGPASGLVASAVAHRSLERYGWVDRDRGIARIPIDRAIDWVVDDALGGPLPSPDPATVVDAKSEKKARP